MPRPPTEPEEEARAAPSRGGAQAAASPRLRQALSPRLQAAAASPPARLSAAGQRPLWGQEPVRHTRGDEGRGPAHWCLLCNQRAQPERSGMSQLPCQGQQEAAWTATALPPSDPPCSLRQGLPGVLSLPRSWALDVHPGGRPSPRRSWQLPSHLGMCGAGVSRLGLQARPGQPPRAWAPRHQPLRVPLALGRVSGGRADPQAVPPQASHCRSRGTRISVPSLLRAGKHPAPGPRTLETSGGRGVGGEHGGPWGERARVYTPALAGCATSGHPLAIRGPQFPQRVLSECCQAHSICRDDTVTCELAPPDPAELPYSPRAGGRAAWAAGAGAASAAGRASRAELWAPASRFRAELKPGRDPRKLPRV